MRQKRRRHIPALLSGIVARLIALAVVLAVIAGVAVPSIRNNIRKRLFPQYTPIAVKTTSTVGHGSCDDARISTDNSTIHWYTRGVDAKTDQVLTVNLAASASGPGVFTGKLVKIGITPVIPENQSASSQALPFPSKFQVTAEPANSLTIPPRSTLVAATSGQPQQIWDFARGQAIEDSVTKRVMFDNLNLPVPPAFQSFNVRATSPQILHVKLLDNDQTPAPAKCVETALIFYQKN
jgi:hypothetical protein